MLNLNDKSDGVQFLQSLLVACFVGRNIIRLMSDVLGIRLSRLEFNCFFSLELSDMN